MRRKARGCCHRSQAWDGPTHSWLDASKQTQHTHKAPESYLTHPSLASRIAVAHAFFLYSGRRQLLVEPSLPISPISPLTGPAGIAATVPSPSALTGIPLIQSTPSLPASSTTGMTNRFSSTLLPNQLTSTTAALISTAPAPYPNAPQGAPIVVSPNDLPIPNKIAQRVWKGEYIDLSEFLPELLGASDPISQGIVSESKGTRKQKVSSTSQWVQCFNAYMSIVALKQPSHITNLLAYSSLIVQAHRKYSGDNWQVYDCNFRQQAAARQPLLWAHIDPGLWTMAFANATANQHCQWCLSLEHPTCECPDIVTDLAVPICRRWNWMECSQSSCTYRHICRAA